MRFLCLLAIFISATILAYDQDELEQRALNNDAKAQYELANLLISSPDSSHQDITKAINYYELAAEQGFIDAYYQLGNIYEEGYFIEGSENKALYYYEKAADQGHKYALMSLGQIYKKGNSVVNQNNKKAIDYFTKAANLGFDEAQLILGEAYVEGEMVDKNISLGYKWLKAAADQQNATAQLHLGFMYNVGYGIREDQRLAKHFLSLACEQGQEDACLMLRDIP